jgi:glycosyltransferase involved in cell wall biosynthesis
MISVVLATYNEEANLKRCLKSVQSWADEMIVVDGSSTDETRQIAREQGAKVIKTSNKPNFHINKQMAIDAAQGELILQLDADEVVDSELAEFIQKTAEKVKQKDYQGPVAWYLKRKNLFLGHFMKKTGQYPDPVIRLFISGQARLPMKDVHEQLEVDGSTATADGHLIHYANPTFKDYLRKWNSYTSFKAQQLDEAGVKINLWQSFRYLCWLPLKTCISLYFRHKGFLDGVPGLVFSIMSGCYHAVAYLKLWERRQQRQLNEELNHA